MVEGRANPALVELRMRRRSQPDSGELVEDLAFGVLGEPGKS